MPTVDVCLWNIQNYGDNLGKYSGTGRNNSLRNWFIAAFLIEHEIDVLMIMEMKPGMDAALSDLVAKLNSHAGVRNRDWAYSFCGCAIKNDTVNVVGGAGDLINRTGARSECYAVVWRGRRDYFTMVPAIAQIAEATSPRTTSPLNISQLGRPTASMPIGPGKWEFGAAGGFERDRVYPYKWVVDSYKPQHSWSKLNYPLTGNMQNMRPSWAGARRPAYVVLQLGDTQNLCPIAVYHAPSKLKRASWGAFMTGLARELFVVDDLDDNRPNPALAPVLADFGFFGGDFNYSVNAGEWALSSYVYFTDPLGKSFMSGAAKRPTPAPTAGDTDRRTTVQIVGGPKHAVPITTDNPDDYLRYKIDLGFNRDIEAITAQRVNLLTELMTEPHRRAYVTPLTQTAAYMDYLKRTAVGSSKRMTGKGPQQGKRGRGGIKWSYLITGSWGSTFEDWNKSRNQYHAHNITDARQAAEYLHIFVSDHLPLIATIRF